MEFAFVAYDAIMTPGLPFKIGAPGPPDTFGTGGFIRSDDGGYGSGIGDIRDMWRDTESSTAVSRPPAETLDSNVSTESSGTDVIPNNPWT